MQNGWSGGQYSVVRGVFGVYLAIHFVNAVRLHTAGTAAVTAIAAVVSVLFAAGWHDRAGAVVLSATLIYAQMREPLGFLASLPFIVALLLLHATLPAAPYGSWAARGRVDPGHAWAMPQWTLVAFWVLLVACYSAMVFGIAVSVVGLAVLHLFAFDPGWIRKPEPAGRESVFYDGHCGLCHGFVRFVVAEDRRWHPFRFTPIDSDTFRRLVPESTRAQLPDSIVVLTEDGRILARSAAVLHVLARLGGLWRMAAGLSRLVPRIVRDRLYDQVALVRRRLFAPPTDVCPVLPGHLRARFEP